MAELVFVSAEYLWLLFIVPALVLTHFYGLRLGKRKALKFANFEALERVTGAFRLSLNLPLLFLRFFTLVSLILALSQPILWYEGPSSEYNFVIAIDSSGSMFADDFPPNRLTAAKESGLTFVDSVPAHSKIGVMSFSGTSFIQQSLTEDKELAKEAVGKIDVEYSSGTAIGDALITATNMLMVEERSRAILLITDGRSNVGTVVEEAIDYANDRFVTIFTIGMGTLEGGRLQGVEAISTLDIATLDRIASSTGGTFYKAGDNEQLLSAYQDVARTSTRKIPFRFAAWLILLTFLLLAVEWVLVNTRFRSIG